MLRLLDERCLDVPNLVWIEPLVVPVASLSLAQRVRPIDGLSNNVCSKKVEIIEYVSTLFRSTIAPSRETLDRRGRDIMCFRFLPQSFYERDQEGR